MILLIWYYHYDHKLNHNPKITKWLLKITHWFLYDIWRVLNDSSMISQDYSMIPQWYFKSTQWFLNDISRFLNNSSMLSHDSSMISAGENLPVARIKGGEARSGRSQGGRHHIETWIWVVFASPLLLVFVLSFVLCNPCSCRCCIFTNKKAF